MADQRGRKAAQDAARRRNPLLQENRRRARQKIRRRPRPQRRASGLSVGLSPTGVHTLFEALAYATGFRMFLWTRKRTAPQAFHGNDEVVIIAVGAIIGAALGAKLSYWLDDPLTAFAGFPDWRHLLEGKSIIGAL